MHPAIVAVEDPSNLEPGLTGWEIREGRRVGRRRADVIRGGAGGTGDRPGGEGSDPGHESGGHIGANGQIVCSASDRSRRSGSARAIRPRP